MAAHAHSKDINSENVKIPFSGETAHLIKYTLCEILNGRTNLPYVSHMDPHRTFPTRHTAAKIGIRNNIF